MAAVVAKDGLVQVMRDLLADGEPGSLDRAGWLGTQLEVSRRVRTDPDFARRWAARSEAVTSATRERLNRQRDAGVLREDVELDVILRFLELTLDGLVLRLAMGMAADDLHPV